MHLKGQEKRWWNIYNKKSELVSYKIFLADLQEVFGEEEETDPEMFYFTLQKGPYAEETPTGFFLRLYECAERHRIDENEAKRAVLKCY